MASKGLNRNQLTKMTSSLCHIVVENALASLHEYQVYPNGRGHLDNDANSIVGAPSSVSPTRSSSFEHILLLT
jgi:hypothetical protein